MNDNSPQPAQPRRPHRLSRWTLRLLVIFILLVTGAELFARYKLGLGDPPLSMPDPQIEYLYQPSKTYHRFGNTVAFNQWSMRSDDFSQHKSDPNELRILLLGDSVINGGAQTDQRDIASEIIRRELPPRIANRSIVVGNASAGSWGPPNLLAYVKKFGFFEADIVIIVLSSHDWSEVPAFGDDLGVDAPTRKPVLALQEAITRYLPRYLPGQSEQRKEAPPEPAPDDPQVQQTLAALRELIALASASGAKVAIAQHLERNESIDNPKPGHAAIAQIARGAAAGDAGAGGTDLSIIQLGPSFEQARRQLQAGDGAAHVGGPYRDHIHPNQLGQRIIAQTLMDWIVANVRESEGR
jgi:lysophospholipase L1-like esterase